MLLKNFYSGTIRICQLLVVLLGTLFTTDTLAQCNALSARRDIFFTPTFGCAPTTVNRFEITYYFTLPQAPAGIQIQYQWNDPANTVTTVSLATGLIASAGNTAFTANATFTYNTNNGQCSIRPTATLIVNGVPCPTSTQMQTAPYWGTDDMANGKIAMAPATWDVCFGNPITNAVFRDASDFNCNIAVEADNPNRLTRNVQFVYGTNNNPPTSIRDLTLNDGATRILTNAAGVVPAPITRGTAGLLVTGAYFGPVDALPFPADGPTSVTFPMNAPANALNLIGHRFEITLFNWNVCNPWNGDPINPNYDQARMTRGYIVIVAAPLPNFDTRDNAGNPTRDFCINETINAVNLTPSVNSYSYRWEFFDDITGTTVINTSTSKNPKFAYPTGGQKLIRVTASNPTAQGTCDAVFDLIVNIAPSLVAKILVTDLSNIPITPDFCQQAGAPLTTFNVRFKDISVGTITPNTEWRWEFRDENNVLVREEPGAGLYSSVPLGPFDIAYVNKGIYHVKLITRDKITGCNTEADVPVRIFEKPVSFFTTTPVCAGTMNAFTESSTLNPINGEKIVLREWDFNYNGSVFNKDPLFDNQIAFNRSLGAAGIHNVALRVTTDQTGCSDMIVIPVEVYAIPLATFTSDVVSGCSVLKVTFTNTSVAGQPDVVDRYVWEVDQKTGLGFLPVATQRPTDPGFSPLFVKNFVNLSGAAITQDVRLHVFTTHNCEIISPPVTITILPGTASGFISLNYSPFSDNCSPQSVNFSADGPTQALNPTDYQWTVSDISGILTQTSTGTNPAFNYNFINTTQSVKDFSVQLTTSLSGGCSGDSVRTIRISPIPGSDFIIDTLRYDCQWMRIRASATQKGMTEYHWQILENGVPVFTANGAVDTLGYLFSRPSSAGADIAVQIKLDTKNFANCTSPVTTKAFVVPKQDNIIAAFTATPISQSLPNSTVTITNTSSGPGQYVWDFGDSTTSNTTAGSFTHVYNTYGTYVISLTITNGVCMRKQTAAVTILAIPPVVDFDYAPPSGCAPLIVTFTNKSKFADPSSYVWDFGDGQGTSNDVNPVYTYYQPGTYSVSLSAANITGPPVKITKLLIIEVFPSPVAAFEIRPRVIILPGTLYTSNRSFGATTYTWSFGDGATSTEPQPQHQYTAEGSFDITLVVSNDKGCRDSTTLKSAVKVEKGGQVLIPNGFTPSVSDGGPGGNSNGRNDTFLPMTRGVTDFELLIFNRWGELLFQSHDQTVGWDGTFNGKLCQQDVYAYKLTAKYENGETLVRIGDVNLIR